MDYTKSAGIRSNLPRTRNKKYGKRYGQSHSFYHSFDVKQPESVAFYMVWTILFTTFQTVATPGRLNLNHLLFKMTGNSQMILI